jgi:hypothetical protein
MIYQAGCARASEGGLFSGYFLDTTEDAATNETRCLHRASEFHGWCENPRLDRTVAVFLGTAALEVFPPYGCALFQRGCPAAGNPEALEGVFFDSFEDSYFNETRCLQRALDFRVYCHPPASPEAVSATYAPTGKNFMVQKLGPIGAAASPRVAVNIDVDPMADPPARVEAPTAEADDGTLTVNTTVRLLGPQARAAPHFAAAAFPLALLALAGDFLDCNAPPLPRGSAAAACAGPQAALAAEALGLYLQAAPDDADAHYNRGVAFYTLTHLNYVSVPAQAAAFAAAAGRRCSFSMHPFLPPLPSVPALVVEL